MEVLDSFKGLGGMTILVVSVEQNDFNILKSSNIPHHYITSNSILIYGDDYEKAKEILLH